MNFTLLSASVNFTVDVAVDVSASIVDFGTRFKKLSKNCNSSASGSGRGRGSNN